MNRVDVLRQKLEETDQLHIFDIFPNLGENDPIFLQLEQLNIEKTLNDFREAKISVVDSGVKVEPVPLSVVCDWDRIDKSEQNRLSEIGYNAIRESRIAAIIMSGGQGTRLGYNGPKGMYCIGLPSGKCIFQIHIERIMKLKLLTSTPQITARIPIYIMTSDLNTTEITNYFTFKNYFGYPKEDIFFFEQGLQPCLTFDGKLIIESPTTLSLAPDGNGGIYEALRATGALDDMISRNVEYLHIYGIDNVLTKSVDPGFMGLCIDRNVECGNKVVWRNSVSEKVGVTAFRNNRICVIEYSEIPPDMASLMDENQKLIFGAANICNHYLKLSFIRDVVLPALKKTYHIASKKIPFYDPVSNSTITPSKDNGIKLELFIFDIFPLSERSVVMQVDRDNEFAPVKNASGASTDSPDTARAMMSRLSRKWLHSSGVHVNESASERDDVCEICPLLSYEGEGLSHMRASVLTPPFYLTTTIEDVAKLN